jgi:Ca2+-binding RTX toxin-like protein
MAPIGSLSAEDAQAAFAEQARALAEGGVDAVREEPIEAGAFVDLVEVRERLAGADDFAGRVLDWRAVGVVEDALDEIARGEEVLEALLVLDADGLFQVTIPMVELGSTDNCGGSPDGTDTVTNVEFITFGGTTYQLVLGTNGGESLSGSAANELLLAFDSNDTLTASGGNDILQGGSGNDTLTGGTGNDTFVVAAGTDTIIDLGNGVDIVDEHLGCVAELVLDCHTV